MIQIGTRGSPLAIRQADGAGSGLVQPYQLIQIKSQGDVDQKTPIHEMGGKHIFCSAIEEKLLSGEIDCAIHSAKDMATEVKAVLDGERKFVNNKFIIQSNLQKKYEVHDPKDQNSLDSFLN